MEISLVFGVLRQLPQSLLNGIWQTALLAILITLLLAFLKKENASTRYAIWFAALFLLLILPIAASVYTGGHDMRVRREIAVRESVPASQNPAPANEPLFLISPVLLKIGFAILLVAAIARLLALLRCWRSLTRMKWEAAAAPEAMNERFHRLAGQYKIDRNVELRLSDDTGFPITIGFQRPVVLVPKAVSSYLNSDELEQIWMHELSHIERRDDWTRLIQKIFEAVFFFYPAVFWIAKQLDLEREIACDDMVLKKSGHARAYAHSLTRLIEMSGRQPSVLAPGALISRSQFCRRIDMLLNKNRNRSTSLSKSGLAAAAAVLAVAFAFLIRVSPLVAVVSDTESDSRMRAAAAQLYSAEQEMLSVTQQQKRSSGTKEAAEAQQMMNAARERMRSAIREMEQARSELEAAREEMRHSGKREAIALHRMRINLPRISVHVPDIHVEVPEQNIHIAGEPIRVPVRSVHVEAIDVEIPEHVIDAPMAVPAVAAMPEMTSAAPAPPAPASPAAVKAAPSPRTPRTPVVWVPLPRIKGSAVAPATAPIARAEVLAVPRTPKPGKPAVESNCKETREKTSLPSEDRN